MKGKKGNILKYSLLFVLAALLVWLAFRGLDWGAFFDGLARTRWVYVLLFCMASILALVFRAARWKMLLDPLGNPLRGVDVWDAINVGNLVNSVLPGAGEFVRCGYVSPGKSSYGKSFGTLVMERAWDVLAMIVLLAAALLFGWDRFGGFFVENVWQPLAGRLEGAAWWIAGGVAVAVAVVVFLLCRRRPSGHDGGLLRGIAEGFVSVMKMDRKGLFILYTVLVWAMYVLMSWFGLKAVPMLSGLGFADALFISAVGNFAAIIPVPGGVGAYHYLVALTLSSLYASTWEVGILYATLCHEVHAVLVIALGVISYFAFSFRKNS